MTIRTVVPRIRSEVKPDRPAGGVEGRLAAMRRKLPELWDSAASALAKGQDQLAGLAIRRRRVLMSELESLSFCWPPVRRPPASCHGSRLPTGCWKQACAKHPASA